MTSAIRFRQAVALLGGFPALAGVDLDVDVGEVVLLRGPNGAGKTTLLRACAGLVPVSAGQASVLGTDVRSDPMSVRRRVGYAGVGAGLYSDLTVVENVEFWNRAAGRDRGSAAEALELMGLGGRLGDQSVASLSTGQRKRVLLAVLIARRPEMWLLDEPHAGLDAAGRDLVDHLLVRAVADGATVVLASHEADRAERIAHRWVTVAGGVVVPDGEAPGADDVGSPSLEATTREGAGRAR